MITLRLDDPHLVENFDAVQNIRARGWFSDEEIQQMYDDQLRRDKEAEAALSGKGVSHEENDNQKQ